MGDAPQPPGELAAQLDPAEVGDRRALADGREARPHACTGRRRRGLAAQPRLDDLGDIAPSCLAAGAMPGTGSPSGPLIDAVSPMAKISGWPGTVRSGSTKRRPTRSAGAPSQSAAREACTPAAQRMVRAASRWPPKTTPSRVAFRDRLAELDLDAELFERLLRVGRELLIETGQDARAGLDQNDARGARVDMPEILAQILMRQLGDGAGEFDAGRTGADDDEGQQRRLASAGPVRARPRSKASRMRRRMVVASSSVLRPGAKGSHSSCPK